MTKATDQQFLNIAAEAWQAGMAAGLATHPNPMVVNERADPLDDTSAIVKQYEPVMGGACGFAWVSFKGNTAFGRWAKKTGLARKDYPTGLAIWVSEFGQSLEMKAAFANAYARVLETHGIVAYGQSRID